MHYASMYFYSLYFNKNHALLNNENIRLTNWSYVLIRFAQPNVNYFTLQFP